MSVKRVLVVEDDRWIADVLVQLVESASPGAQVDWQTEVPGALGAFEAGTFDLVLCDWNLPGQPGLELVDHVRARADKTPIVMITGRSDRASVIAARTQGADAFIIKPFQVDRVLALITRYLAAPEPGDAAKVAPELLSWLAALPDSALELPMMQSIRQGVELLGEQEPPDLRVLANEWEHQPALSLRLVTMANSAAFNTKGILCTSLAEALTRLGWKTSVNVATAMAMRQSARIEDSQLESRARRQMELADEVGERVFELAHRCRVEPSACHTAALLHRIGELCVLYQIQHWQNQYGQRAGEAQIDAAMARFSESFAERIKAVWRLPMPIRELIDAIHRLLPGTTRQEAYLMRVAGNLVYAGLTPEEDAKLRRLAGLL